MKIEIDARSLFIERVFAKGNGRIFVKKPDVAFIKQTIRRLDKEEYDQYFPEDFVTVLKQRNNKLVYTGKFTLDVAKLRGNC